MARRITKSASRRSDDWQLPHFKIFPELPGAVFVGRGRPSDDDLERPATCSASVLTTNRTAMLQP